MLSFCASPAIIAGSIAARASPPPAEISPHGFLIFVGAAFIGAIGASPILHAEHAYPAVRLFGPADWVYRLAQTLYYAILSRSTDKPDVLWIFLVAAITGVFVGLQFFAVVGIRNLNIFQGYKTLIFKAAAAQFESDYSLDESVARLSKLTADNFFWKLTYPEMIGSISESGVSLRRCDLLSNPFRPYFSATFDKRGDKIVLVGRFAMKSFAELVISACFGFLLLGIVSAFLATVFNGGVQDWMILIGGVEVFLALTAIVRFGQWQTRDDVRWMTVRIRNALSEKSS